MVLLKRGIVIDVGCATHGGDESIRRLIDGYQPKLLFGLDPQVRADAYTLDATEVHLYPLAGWVADEMITMRGHGLGMGVRYDGGGGIEVQGVDLARWIDRLPADTPLIVKLDAEGSEWRIVPHLIDSHSALQVSLLLIEWHCLTCLNGIWSHMPGCEDNGLSERKAAQLEKRWPGRHERWEA